MILYQYKNPGRCFCASSHMSNEKMSCSEPLNASIKSLYGQEIRICSVYLTFLIELMLRRDFIKAKLLSTLKSIIKSSPVPSTSLPWAIKVACPMCNDPRKAKNFFPTKQVRTTPTGLSFSDHI